MLYESKGQRHSYAAAVKFADEMCGILKSLAHVGDNDCFPAGSIRRKKPDVGDVDIMLFSSHAPYDLFLAKLLENYHIELVQKGVSQLSVWVEDRKTKDGFQVEVRNFLKQSFRGAGLLFATGNGEFNIAMRGLAKSMGLALNRYELKDRVTSKHVAGETEEGVFQALGLAFVPPEQRNGAAALRKQSNTVIYHVQSKSEPGKYHDVTLTPLKCDCAAFKWRSTCTHVAIARGLQSSGKTSN